MKASSASSSHRYQPYRSPRLPSVSVLHRDIAADFAGHEIEDESYMSSHSLEGFDDGQQWEHWMDSLDVMGPEFIGEMHSVVDALQSQPIIMNPDFAPSPTRLTHNYGVAQHYNSSITSDRMEIHPETRPLSSVSSDAYPLGHTSTSPASRQSSSSDTALDENESPVDSAAGDGTKGRINARERNKESAKKFRTRERFKKSSFDEITMKDGAAVSGLQEENARLKEEVKVLRAKLKEHDESLRSKD